MFFLEVNQSESIILEAPSVDARLLPIIGSSASEEDYDNDEEIVTPMVDGSYRQFPNLDNNNTINSNVTTKNSVAFQNAENKPQN